ncbi:hypothetical protein [Winogradskya consettensis]|nr:hypothetical protein [Actinoplanes consettensis]
MVLNIGLPFEQLRAALAGPRPALAAGLRKSPSTPSTAGAIIVVEADDV